jgi:hypothetical protein
LSEQSGIDGGDVYDDTGGDVYDDSGGDVYDDDGVHEAGLGLLEVTGVVCEL